MARFGLVSAIRRMPHPVRRVLLARSAVLWVCAHVVGVTGAILNGPVSHPAALAPPAALLTVLLVSGLTVLDVRRRGEHVLFGNLGIGTGIIGVTGALLPAAGEVVISLVAAL